MLLFGGKARLSGFWQGDDVVAKMVASDPDRYLGFLTLDLSQPDWRNDLERGHRDLKLRGVKLMPINRDTARLLFGCFSAAFRLIPTAAKTKQRN